MNAAAPTVNESQASDGDGGASDHAPPGAPVREGRARAASGAPRILIVDDEEDIRDALELAFLHEGYEVVTADGGAAAMREATASRYDVAITDLRMPGMSGVDTITALRSIDPEIRVIVASGYASEETAADCMQRGAAGYLPKPFDLDDLLDTVRRVLAAR